MSASGSGLPEEKIEKTAAEQWAAPPSAPTGESTSDTAPDTEAAQAQVAAVPSQNLVDEEAAIAKQIESIIDTPAATAETPAPAWYRTG